MRYLWYIEYGLTILCPVAMAIWLFWLARRRHEWHSMFALRFIGAIMLIAVFGLPYSVLCNPRIWDELLSGDMGNPHLRIFVLAWTWLPCMFIVWESATIRLIAKRAVETGRPEEILRTLPLISAAPIFAWIIAMPQVFYLGGWSLMECGLILLGGVIMTTMFPFIVYSILEPVVNMRFVRSSAHTGLGQRLSIATWILLINVILSILGVILGNIFVNPPIVVLNRIGVTLSLFILPYAYLITRLVARSTEAVEENEKKSRALSEASQEGIAIHDEGVLLAANEKYYAIFDRTPEEWEGKYTLKDTYPVESIKILLEKKRSSDAGTFETTAFKPDGTEFPVSIRAEPTKYRGREVKVMSVRDLTRDKEAEQEKADLQKKLIRSRKMEALGLLAGGVAHDLNNILSGVVSYPELLLMDDNLDPRTRKSIEAIQKSGHKATAIVSDLLTMARGAASVKKAVSLNRIVEEYLESPEHRKIMEFHPNVRVATELDPGLLNINGSSIHIQKVIMNLVSNASEAIDNIEGGSVVISTSNRYVDRPLKGYDDVYAGEYTLLSISDNGPGISPDDIERIFEPFYTKKVMGRSGTGLGLTVVWNTMQDHEGYIDMMSGKEGTSFDLYFPITRNELADAVSAIPVETFKGNREKVLVVDDMPSQREIACKMLDRLGYSAAAVASGEKAIEYLREKTADLLVLDMIMDPGMNGRETYERAKDIHPGQKAVIASGFAETTEVKEAQRQGAGQYIKKPYTLEKLGLAVKEELGGR